MGKGVSQEGREGQGGRKEGGRGGGREGEKEGGRDGIKGVLSLNRSTRMQPNILCELTEMVEKFEPSHKKISRDKKIRVQFIRPFQCVRPSTANHSILTSCRY